MEENNEIKQLLEENIKINQEILSLCKEIEHHNKLARLYGFIKTIVIIVPIIVGALLLIPYVKQGLNVITEYSSLQEFLK